MLLYSQHTILNKQDIEEQLNRFYQEDQTFHDLSTLYTTKNNNPYITAALFAEESLVVAGLSIIDVMFQKYKVNKHKKDGELCASGDNICSITAPASILLSYERILLNLIQRMSGIASLTNIYVKTLNSPTIKILDTRKTTPGLRLFEKHAVSIGGGYNHRFDLNDGVMIKDNHLTIINDLDLILQTLKADHPNKKIELEVDTVDQLKLFLTSLSIKLDAVLLDNMNKHQTIQCVELIRKNQSNCFIESSGGINLNNILNYQDTSVDGISIGALTHQAKSKNIKVEFKSHDKE